MLGLTIKDKSGLPHFTTILHGGILLYSTSSIFLRYFTSNEESVVKSFCMKYMGPKIF